MFKKNRTTNILFQVFTLITAFLFFSCQTYKESIAHKKMYKTIYIDQFKLTYFRQLVMRSYNNSIQIKQIIALDHSGFTEGILTENDYKLIDSLTFLDNQKLVMDSTNSIGKVAEGAEGKHIFIFLIKRIGGKWLDSLARSRYKFAKVNIRFPEY